MGNPEELSGNLLGQKAQAITVSGAPQGERKKLVATERLQLLPSVFETEGVCIHLPVGIERKLTNDTVKSSKKLQGGWNSCT